MDAVRYRAAEAGFWASEGVAPTEDVVRLANHEAPVRVQRAGSGPPVVFLHGVNTSGAVFAPLVAALRDVECIVLDRPGCGLSDPAPTTTRDVATFAAFADDMVVDLLDALGVERAHLVGTSLGGYFAIRTAAAHADRIASVSLLGWPVGAPNGHLPLVMRVGGARPLGKLMARLPAPEAAMKPMLSRIGLRQAVRRGRVSDEMVRWFHSLLRDTETMRNELMGAPPIIHPLRGMNEDILHRDALLSAVRPRVQLLWGDADPFGDVGVARSFARKFNDSELSVRVGSGHAPWIDEPEAVARDVATFIGGCHG